MKGADWPGFLLGDLEVSPFHHSFGRRNVCFQTSVLFKGLEMKWFQKFFSFPIHKSLVEMGVDHCLCRSFAVVICKKHFGSLFQNCLALYLLVLWVSVLPIYGHQSTAQRFSHLNVAKLHVNYSSKYNKVPIKRLQAVPFHKSVYNTSFSLKCLEQTRCKEKVNKMIMFRAKFSWA